MVWLLPQIGLTDDADVIQVTRPMLIGFFPEVSEAQLNEIQGAASALDHWSYALQKTEQCLGGTDVKVSHVRASLLKIENGNALDQLDLSEPSNNTIGCYLAAPGRAPVVVYASAGPSSLLVLCPAAASGYFEVPSCCPDGFRCCPDGRMIDVELRCEGQ